MKKPFNNAEQFFFHFCEAYGARSLATMLELFTPNATLIGTVCDEHRIGLKEIEAQLQRDWSQSEQGAIVIASFFPSPSSGLWASALCHTTIIIDGQSHHFENLRGSIVIEEVEKDWKIAHMHASFPDLRSPKGYSFPQTK